MFSYSLRTVNETFNVRQIERSFFLAWVDKLCQFHLNCKWLSLCCVRYRNVSDYVYSVRRLIIEFSLSSRILLYIFFLCFNEKVTRNVTFFLYRDENVASCKQVQDYINHNLLSFSPIYWYLFNMYAYCSLGSSLRSFLVVNIVRKGFPCSVLELLWGKTCSFKNKI